MKGKGAEQWREILEAGQTRCGSVSCQGDGTDRWGERSMPCPLWQAAAELGLTPGDAQGNREKGAQKAGRLF